MAAFLEKAAEQEEVFRKECLYIRLFPFIKALIANKIARNMANARARSHQEQQPIGLPKSLSVGHLLLDNISKLRILLGIAFQAAYHATEREQKHAWKVAHERASYPLWCQFHNISCDRIPPSLNPVISPASISVTLSKKT
jgi:hypothetical protein